jgi:DNA polymerase III subunit epsilon
MAQDDLSEPAFIARYRARFLDTWTDQTNIDDVRFVVLDSETTGFDARNDRIITIGAVVVQHREIVLADSFESLLKIERNTSAVTVHGVTRDESESGVEEPVALELLLEYLKDGVIVGHHIGHDIAALNAAYERNWNLTLLNRWIDTLLLSELLQRDGALPGQRRIRRLSLEALGDMFQVIPHDRHTAAGDAFITAQIFLRLLRLALKAGRSTLAPLGESPAEED